MLEQSFKQLEELFPEIVEIRRDLHMYPELSFKEVRTPKIIADYLKNLGIEVRTGVGGNGVVGYLKGGKPGKTIALRADFDALAVVEEKEVPYRSNVPGVMHACGHDIHTAALLGVAKVLSKMKDQIEGNVVFLHQHAEELVPGGAKSMIEDKCLENVDIVYGAHVESNFPIGSVAINEGFVHASSDRFEIVIYGKGGHGAEPHWTVDPLIIGSQLNIDLQQIVSRKIDPLQPVVVTIGSFHSGDAPNVIPDKATIKGTVRTYDEEVRKEVAKYIKQISEKSAEKMGARAEVSYFFGYPSLYNHPGPTHKIREIAVDLLGKENVYIKKPDMGAEDFAYYTKEVPGTFFWVGGRNPDIQAVYPHHHPKFDVDETSMLYIGKVYLSAILKQKVPQS